jgi:glycosyltransferase involved in cell wall biosynthesis
MKKVALFDPYLDTLGGGEKHILSIVEVLAEKGYEVNIFWDKNLAQEIKERFQLRFVDRYKFIPNVFKTSNPLETYKALSRFDYFFYVTDGSYFLSGAKNNFVFAMVPDKKLYSLNIVNRLKLWNYKFISNSPYTTKWLNSWGINPVTITPYLTPDILGKKPVKKEKTILSVARFFPHLHSKNQKEIIETFKKLKEVEPLFKNYKLVLAGGLKDEDREYFNGLETVAGRDESITFKTNLKKQELIELYRQSSYFWHFTGLYVDEKNHPETVEHFGIAPIEAMATGAVTFCHNSGGPRDFIIDRETGYLFDNADELIDKMVAVEKDLKLKDKIVKQAYDLVKKRYNYEIFKDKVTKLL